MIFKTFNIFFINIKIESVEPELRTLNHKSDEIIFANIKGKFPFFRKINSQFLHDWIQEK